MQILNVKEVKGGYLRFDLETEEGILIKGFRTTSGFKNLLEPQANYLGRQFPVVEVPLTFALTILEKVRHEYEHPTVAV